MTSRLPDGAVRFDGVVDSGLEEAVELFLRLEDAEWVVHD
jgi:hypothetical protein